MTRLIGDLISRNALLEFIHNNFKAEWDYPSVEDVTEIITNAPTIQREGWVSVPIEPTQDMCQQGQWKANEWKQFPLRITSIYKAMIQAAPTNKE